MTLPQERNPAPDFSLQLDDGSSVSLTDLLGKPIVLYFYPADDTTGCTTENKEFSALAPEFVARGVKVIGISPDSLEKHGKFRDKHALTIPLAADPELATIKAYDLWQPKKLYGREFMGLIRTSFLIGADGTIVRIVRATRVAGHAQKMLDAVDTYLAARD